MSAADTGSGDLLDVLHKGAVVAGLVGSEPVTVMNVTRVTDDCVEIVYRTEAGAFSGRMVFAHELAALSVAIPGAAFAFTSEPAAFKLAAEGRRLQLAHLFDPQAALGTSDVDPLPHQLRAVYEEMLPRHPLRYVLADDPGAGKTVMAGLLVKELVLRGDGSNVLVVAPGSLVDQWHDEMASKFDLDFQILSRDMVDGVRDPFARGGLWLARMDVLARNNLGVLDHACNQDWDLVIFDEAHKMSASVSMGDVARTRRYAMGERLGVARNVLMMTATPHSGKGEQFQLFMALLDADRFEGAAREGARGVDVNDLMRRLVKEELLRFDGTRLFPRRASYTVQYPLTPAEARLYHDVTDYVRHQMNLADRMSGEGGRRMIVGFALTTLQRRLASSPAAIYRSLDRRLARLESELREARAGVAIGMAGDRLANFDQLDDLEDLTDEEREATENAAIAGATPAASVEELEAEIVVLRGLVAQARGINDSPTYSKWDHLRGTLDDNPEMRDESGARRKVILFTEHKDTLDDLVARLRNHLGRDEAVVVIHGGVRREDRLKAQERFRTDDDVVFLVATDAAGEGVNLQNAHLLINFDLPWNPNRIEQRFGRIHRIGQRHMCHMWSLMAQDTREGNVYARLLQKLEQQREALQGRVYDVLGTVFEGDSLRDLMIRAIREGESPEVQAELFEVVDRRIGEGIRELLETDSLVPTQMTSEQIGEVRRDMERAEAARLQPHHVEAFTAAAFETLGGRLRPREHNRYEIRSVPAPIKDIDRIAGRGAPVMAKYSRVCFDRADQRIPNHTADATLLHPGHPLVAAIIRVVNERYGATLRQGAILVDRNDPQVKPHVVCLLEHDITDGRADSHGRPQVISRRVQFVRIDPDGTITPVGQSPIPDLDVPNAGELDTARRILGEPWAAAHDLDQRALQYGAAILARSHYDEVTATTHARVERTRRLVRERLTQEIQFWDARATEYREAEQAGRRTRLSAGQAAGRADALALRMDRRLAELAREDAVAAAAPRVTGAALVVPQGWFDALTDPEGAAARARETTRVERIAVDAVLDAEHALGHNPVEMPHNNPGYDIESDTPDGLDFIEVKGRVEGGDTFILTRQESVTALNKGANSVLALVRVHPDDTTSVRYIRRPLTEPIPPWQTATEADWNHFWNQGADPRSAQ